MYTIKLEEYDEEKDWLHNMKIFPAVSEYHDYTSNKKLIKIGVIVPPDSALLIKLRHPLQFQKTYKQK